MYSSDSCLCSHCSDQYKDHSEYHRSYHVNCKFCDNIINQIPHFNYWFLNRNVRMLHSREHFNMRSLCVNTKPPPEEQNPNYMSYYSDYDTYPERKQWFFLITVMNVTIKWELLINTENTFN